MQKIIFTKDFECKHTDLVQQENSFKSFIYSLLLIVNSTIFLPSFVTDMSSLSVFFPVSTTTNTALILK